MYIERLGVPCTRAATLQGSEEYNSHPVSGLQGLFWARCECCPWSCTVRRQPAQFVLASSSLPPSLPLSPFPFYANMKLNCGSFFKELRAQ